MPFLFDDSLGRNRSRTVEMMHRGERLVLAAAEEPVTRQEAKDWCRISTGVTKEDALFDTLISAARDMVETETRRKLITSTWEVIYDRFPGPHGGDGVYGFETFGTIELPFGITQAVTSIKYQDTLAVEQTLAFSEVIIDLDSEPARITPAKDKFFPATNEVISSVKIVFITGYGAAAAIPAGLKQVIRLLILDMYAHREAQYEIILRENRLYDNLINTYRLPTFMDIT